MQLTEVGKQLRPEQRVRFLYTYSEPGVIAWDLPEPLPAVTAVNVPRYTRLLVRAASAVLYPLGLEETEIWRQMHGLERQLPLTVSLKPYCTAAFFYRVSLSK